MLVLSPDNAFYVTGTLGRKVSLKKEDLITFMILDRNSIFLKK